MIKYIAILLLAGCATAVPVKQVFPSVPEELLKPCPSLTIIETQEIKLSELLNIVSANYSKYYQCSNVLEAWTTWYKENKKISEE